MEIIDKEKPAGVIAQFGGQTAINLLIKLSSLIRGLWMDTIQPIILLRLEKSY